ncbi:hypothetical protein P1X14_20785 [Sphingomonas sp. AOB5]|uniref:hypothetical protein n=1 Tax=Sphingomonas sp. AOB5 TaxID=3034017 RepID=UPI0023F8A3E1|nr:hypothetical protein [Sphingomonas sp. AOB5]MDF7777704.1 hypothetical protein [Sphingomonas sp. AOB5]
MLFLTLALSIASPVMAMPPELQRARPVSTKRKTSRKRAPVRVVRLTPACGVATPCSQDPNQRYRLTGSTTIIPDAKGREVARSQGMACGTTGAPVCPSNGATLIRTSD